MLCSSFCFHFKVSYDGGIFLFSEKSCLLLSLIGQPYGSYTVLSIILSLGFLICLIYLY